MMKTVGIMGGMGPLATVDMMDKIISHTSVQSDQEHIHVIVDNYPQIPDRTDFIFNRGSDPVPYMIQSAQLLERAGANMLVIACNLAHYFIKEIENKIDIPILHMQMETAKYVKKSGISKVGLIAAKGTIDMDLYHKPFQALGITILEPVPEMQKIVMDAIYKIKAGNLDEGGTLLKKVANSLAQQGVDHIVAGCTEVPLVLHSTKGLQVIDPTEILAQSVIKVAKK